jgi:hypothetical protein
MRSPALQARAKLATTLVRLIRRGETAFHIGPTTTRVDFAKIPAAQENGRGA